MLCRQRGLLDRAISRMRRVAELDPESLAPELNVAYFLLEACRREEALGEFRRLRGRAPDEARVRYGLALASSGLLSPMVK